MSDNEEFIPINKMISRDFNQTDMNQNNQNQSEKIYQVQGNNNKSTCNLIYLGKHDTSKLSIQNILTFQHPKYKEIKCEMLGYTMEANEITKSNYLKLIGFLLSIDDKIICSCDYVFYPNDNTLLNILPSNNIDNINGTFKIILFYKKNEKYYHDVIKEYTEYNGKEESIYILATVLLEENVIEKYFEKYTQI